MPRRAAMAQRVWPTVLLAIALPLAVIARTWSLGLSRTRRDGVEDGAVTAAQAATSHVNERATMAWWLADDDDAARPFAWTFAPLNASSAPFSERVFPCEATCLPAKQRDVLIQARAACRDECGADCSATSSLNWTKCAASVATCLRTTPRFLLRPPRALFTLADTALLFVGKPRVRVSFMGDSHMEVFFGLARCHLARLAPAVVAASTSAELHMKHCQVKTRSGVQGAIAKAIAHVFYLADAAMAVEVVFYASRRVPVDDVALLAALCAESDVFLFNWAAWYKTDDVFDAHMRTALAALGECQRANGTVVVDAGKPQPHFKSSNGEHPPAAEQGDSHPWHCAPLRNASADNDAYGPRVRANVLPGLAIDWIPPPWDDASKALCPRVVSGSAAAAASTRARLHWVPYASITRGLWAFHQESKGDCSHLLALHGFGEPLWDAVFLAALADTSLARRTCAHSLPRPRFAAVRSDVPLRDRQRALANFGAVNNRVLAMHDVAAADAVHILALESRRDADFSRENAALAVTYANETALGFGPG